MSNNGQEVETAEEVAESVNEQEVEDGIEQCEDWSENDDNKLWSQCTEILDSLQLGQKDVAEATERLLELPRTVLESWLSNDKTLHSKMYGVRYLTKREEMSERTTTDNGQSNVKTLDPNPFQELDGYETREAELRPGLLKLLRDWLKEMKKKRKIVKKEKILCKLMSLKEHGHGILTKCRTLFKTPREKIQKVLTSLHGDRTVIGNKPVLKYSDGEERKQVMAQMQKELTRLHGDRTVIKNKPVVKYSDGEERKQVMARMQKELTRLHGDRTLKDNKLRFLENSMVKERRQKVMTQLQKSSDLFLENSMVKERRQKVMTQLQKSSDLFLEYSKGEEREQVMTPLQKSSGLQGLLSDENTLVTETKLITAIYTATSEKLSQNSTPIIHRDCFTYLVTAQQSLLNESTDALGNRSNDKFRTCELDEDSSSFWRENSVDGRSEIGIFEEPGPEVISSALSEIKAVSNGKSISGITNNKAQLTVRDAEGRDQYGDTKTTIGKPIKLNKATSIYLSGDASKGQSYKTKFSSDWGMNNQSASGGYSMRIMRGDITNNEVCLTFQQEQLRTMNRVFCDWFTIPFKHYIIFLWFLHNLHYRLYSSAQEDSNQIIEYMLPGLRKTIRFSRFWMVTEEVFSDAIRSTVVIGNLYYTVIYPTDSRMNLYLPVFEGGFIHEKDTVEGRIPGDNLYNSIQYSPGHTDRQCIPDHFHYKVQL